MAVHLLKLCVGIEHIEALRQWQANRLVFLASRGEVPELYHRTRHMPRRRTELLDGGSLYWVIKGFICARQRILDLKPMTKDDGSACCGIVLDTTLVPTAALPRRPFQGWRYLATDEAPPDLSASNESLADMPPGMREELRSLRLID
ncbi:MAG: DUF1489 domain-containing protein [Pseudomonadota bacterium]